LQSRPERFKRNVMNLQRKKNISAGKISCNQSSEGRLKPLIIFAVLISLTLLVPWPIVKIAAFFAVVISLTFFNSISRKLGIVLLGFLFALAYLFSPYWLYITTIKSNTTLQTIGVKPVMFITMILLILTGLIWSYLAAGNITVQVNQAGQRSFIRRVLPLAALALLVLACNYGPLCNNVSVLGDESYHITRIRFLHTFLYWFFAAAKNLFLPAIVTLALIILFALWKRCRAETIIGIVLAGILAIYLGTVAYYSPDFAGRLDMLRYPFLSCWFGNLGPIWRVNPYDERLFRVIPLLSAFGIGVFSWWAARKQNVTPIAAFILAFALTLTPAVYYYSTSLYLELPAVVLLLFVMYYIEPILTEDFESVRGSPGWYALMAVGFIKETLIALIAGIIVLRLLVRGFIIGKNKALTARTFLNETAAAFCIAVPSAIYILLRLAFGQPGTRAYGFSFDNIANASLFIVAAKSIWNQFGLILPIALGGLVLCIYKRRFILTFSMIALFLIHFFFHFMEKADLVGLARFNLFLFPILAVPAIIGLGWLTEKNRLAVLAAVVALLLVNILMSPVALTGEKDPLWSSPGNKVTTEYYFPLEKSVVWLKEHYPRTPVYISGAYGDSNILWYFDKIGYHPPFIQATISPDTPPVEALTAAAEQASKLGAPILIWHKMQPGPELAEKEKFVLNYKAIKELSNRNLAIVIYERQR
jgi:hypothetical protein